jgi:hypothetical protein
MLTGKRADGKVLSSQMLRSKRETAEQEYKFNVGGSI